MIETRSESSVGIHGPGAALDFHVRLFADLDRVDKWASENEGRRVKHKNVPPILQQRGLLISASSKLMLASVGGSIELQAEDGAHTLGPDDLNKAGTSENIMAAAHLVGAERDVLDKAATWYVSHSVKEVVSRFAEAAEPEPLFATDIPSTYGLIVLEHPLLLDDLDPETGEQVPGLLMPITAIGWKVSKTAVPVDGKITNVDGIVYYLYTTEKQWEHYYIPAARKILKRDEAELAMLIANRSVEWSFMSDYSGWAFGRSWSVSDSVQDSRPGFVPDSVSFIRRWLLAFFRFTWQQILVGHVHHPSRAEKRRFERVKQHVPEDGYIKVVRLRRELEAEARGERPTEGDAVWRSHQWIVRGHPRRQWYRSLGPARNLDGSFNHDSHRLIWIEAHAAGNPFGQLVVGHEVVAVVR